MLQKPWMPRSRALPLLCHIRGHRSLYQAKYARTQLASGAGLPFSRDMYAHELWQKADKSLREQMWNNYADDAHILDGQHYEHDAHFVADMDYLTGMCDALANPYKRAHAFVHVATDRVLRVVDQALVAFLMHEFDRASEMMFDISEWVYGFISAGDKFMWEIDPAKLPTTPIPGIGYDAHETAPLDNVHT